MTGLRGRHFWVGLGAFLMTASAALLQTWSLPEFCWTVWIAGLAYSWACVLSGAVGVLWTARRDRGAYETFHPFFGRISEGAFLSLVAALVTVASLVALYIYSYIFGFYGLFLSVFAEMKDNPMFVRNGFINSDFVTPVMYLLKRFWPMVLAMLVTNGWDLVTGRPWLRLLLPVMTREVLRMHLFVFLLPILTLGAWALFQRDYQPVTVVLLLGFFFLMPKTRPPVLEGASPPRETA